ncbi:MAG: HEAT repeat domain-containing protein [Gammaproteobacteria bacterium]|nr:HEAT repeat domain-containing protein [Gammaproteobacteria bacterium]
MQRVPSVLLFISADCPHCSSVLTVLGNLVKSGAMGTLEVVNIQHYPERAQEYNIRSIPWIRIGPFELTGLHSQTELEQWIKRVDDPTAMGDYFSELMTSGELSKVQQLVEDDPSNLLILIRLIADLDTPLSARIGIGVIMEDLSGSVLLMNSVDVLAEHTRHKQTQVRIDACYYLGLSKSAEARQYIEPLLKDDDAEVREVAADALREL